MKGFIKALKAICRLAFPRGAAERTGLYQIKFTEGQGVGLTDIESPPERKVPWDEDPLLPTDERLLVAEIKRALGRDQWQSEANMLLSALLRCNSCVSPLGCNAQCKSAMFYLANYLSKSPADLTNVMGIIHAAHLEMQQPNRRSVAEDAGEPLRTAKHFLTIIQNKISNLTEWSDTQASMCMLGFDSFYTSESFWNLYINQAVRFQQEKFYPDTQDDTEEVDSEDDFEASEESTEGEGESDDGDDEWTGDNSSGNNFL